MANLRRRGVQTVEGMAEERLVRMVSTRPCKVERNHSA